MGDLKGYQVCMQHGNLRLSVCVEQDDANMIMEASSPSWREPSSPYPSSGEEDERMLVPAPLPEVAFRKGACDAQAGGHGQRLTSAKRKASPSGCHGSACKVARHSEAHKVCGISN